MTKNKTLDIKPSSSNLLNTNNKSTPIAVIGLGCYYPGAKNPKQLWENILAKRQQFRQIPNCRLPLADYYHPNKNFPDKTYGKKAAVIEGYNFDWSAKRIPKTAFESTDIAHWLALDTALAAISDAGFDLESIPKDKTGVIVGNTLTGEFTRSNTMRLRWPFVRRVFRKIALEKGLDTSEIKEMELLFEKNYKSVFAPVTEDTLAGGLSNTIAGRICNFCDFHGSGYTVDGACSSSLIAVITAAKALAENDMDIALAGGVDISLDTFELIGFAKTGALTDKDMTVYDKAGSGFIPGEGSGFVVLKRLDDAMADNNKIYAVIKGWGLSSDGKGGMTAPSAKGQALALKRAYDKADYSPLDLDFIEGHGTGTTVGDQIELQGISLLINKALESKNKSGKSLVNKRFCGVTSFKSIVGHTKAAAGVGAFIKTAIALNQRVIPPTSSCKNPHNVFSQQGKNLFPIINGKITGPTTKLRAGVSAMGFGGINSHVTLESGLGPYCHLKPDQNASALLVSEQEYELFVLCAKGFQDLILKANTLLKNANGISQAELSDLAFANNTNTIHCDDSNTKDNTSENPIRAAILASSVDMLVQNLEWVIKSCSQNQPQTNCLTEERIKGIWISNCIKKTKIGFLFPGQGSQKLNTVKTLINRFEWAKEISLKIEEVFLQQCNISVLQKIFKDPELASDEQELKLWQQALSDTIIAQAASVMASLIWFEYLKKLGLNPVIVGGHSLGELMALYSSGNLNKKELINLAAFRAKIMAQEKTKGMMISLRTKKKEAELLIKQIEHYAVIANINSPRQIIVSGTKEAIKSIESLAKKKNIPVKLLPVSNAFHSKLVSKSSGKMLNNAPISDKSKPNNSADLPEMFSSVTAKSLNHIDSKTTLKKYLSDQMIFPVLFSDLVANISQKCDVLVEVGIGNVLSSLVKDIQESKGTNKDCFPVELKANDDKSFNSLIANLVVFGNKINWQYLYKNRLIRPFKPVSEKEFITNPLELSLPNQTDQIEDFLDSQFDDQELKQNRFSEDSNAEQQNLGQGTAADTLLNLAAKRTGFALESLNLNLRLLDDLNLDSIKSAELVASTAQRFKVVNKIDPSNFANSKLVEIADAIQKIVDSQVEYSSIETAIKDQSWVRNFVVKKIPISKKRLSNKNDFSCDKLTIIYDDNLNSKESKTASEEFQVLSKEFQKAGFKVNTLSWDKLKDENSKNKENKEDITAQNNSETQSHVLAILNTNLVSADLISDYEKRLEDLFHIIKYTKEHSSTTVVSYNDDNSISVKDSFLASIHLENPNQKIRVLSFSKTPKPQALSKIFISELKEKTIFRTTYYDQNLTGFNPQHHLLVPSSYQLRKLKLSGQDVVLVTGGAKGITAECAIALAKNTSAKMALVGSSASDKKDKNNPIANTISRFEELGLTANYYQCNITKLENIKELKTKIEKDLGKVTAIIHAAGLNKPRLANTVSLNDAKEEVQPKVLGALNLCQVFSDKQIKLFVGFTSIIGVIGMPGNAWYAFANETLNRIIANYKALHPNTQTLCLAYSVWDEVGMGARMGSTSQLAKKGIGSIKPLDGVEKFLELIKFDPGAQQVIITARLASLDTWTPKPIPKMPKANRFLEKIISFEPDVEVISRVKLSLEHDLYLKDHNFKGSFLFPTVFGLEAMGQAVAYLTNTNKFGSLTIENINLEKPIVVPEDSSYEIEITAEVLQKTPNPAKLSNPETRVKVAISTEQSNFETPHFSAVFILNPNQKPDKTAKNINLSNQPLDLNPKEDLYGWLLFQGPLFQRMKEIYKLTEKEAVFSAENSSPLTPPQGCFSEEKKSPFILGDPFLRDSLLQAVQLSIPQDVCLPIRVGKWQISLKNSHSSLKYVKNTLRKKNKEHIHTETLLLNTNNELLEYLHEYELKIIEHKPNNPTTEKLTSKTSLYETSLKQEIIKYTDILKLKIPEIAFEIIPNLSKLTKEKRHDYEKELFHKTLKKLLIKQKLNINAYSLGWKKNGKPLICGTEKQNINISLSNKNNYCLATAGIGLQGCDIEIIQKRKWHLIFSKRYLDIIKVLKKSQNEDAAYTRVWATLESLKKAVPESINHLKIYKIFQDCVVFATTQGNNDYYILTFPLQLPDKNSYIFALLVDLEEILKMKIDDHSKIEENVVTFQDIGPQGGNRYISRFYTVFKDISSLRRTTGFPIFAYWMGKLREVPMEPIAKNLVPLLATGKYGLVTNYS